MNAVDVPPAVQTPLATIAALVATLAVTGVLATAVAVDALRGALSATTTAAVLAFLTGLFLIRVAGQVLVALRGPAWLPPMEKWNLVPYRLLLPIQVVFVAAMAWLAVTVANAGGEATRGDPATGRALIAFAALYAASMGVRYAVRMRRRPGERWFGGAIPIVFHLVLATFVLTYGAYRAG